MDRKKFVTIFSTSLIGAAIIKANPLNLIVKRKSLDGNNLLKVSLNPDAVKREKPGKKHV